MIDEKETHPEAQVVERTGLAVVHEGDVIRATKESRALLTAEGAAVVHYYFPVEIEVIGPGLAESLMEQMYAAVQQGLEGLA